MIILKKKYIKRDYIITSKQLREVFPELKGDINKIEMYERRSTYNKTQGDKADDIDKWLFICEEN